MYFFINTFALFERIIMQLKITSVLLCLHLLIDTTTETPRRRSQTFLDNNVESNDPENTTDSTREEIISVWMVERGQTMSIAATDNLKFLSSRTYIIQVKFEEATGARWKTYYWIGKHSSAEDAGDAASHAVQIESRVQPNTKVRREAEGHESLVFEELFAHTSARKPRMFTIEGRDKIDFKQVKLSLSYIRETKICLVFLFENGYVHCGHDVSEVHEGTAKRLAELMMQKTGVETNVKTIHRGNNQGPKQPLQQKELLVQLFEEFERIPKEIMQHQIIQYPVSFGQDEKENILHPKPHIELEDFSIKGIRIYTDNKGRVVEQDDSYDHLPLNTLDNRECYLADSTLERDNTPAGLYVWIGKKTSIHLRMETARIAELHLRRKNYHYATRVIYVDETEELPAEVWTMYMLVNHFYRLR